jgi:periplasmic protein TonB
MAYIDQDRSREKMVSGAISVAIVGAVGFGLVSGLAMQVIREKPGEIVGQIWKTAPPPPVKNLPPPKDVHKTSQPTQATPTQTPQQVPDTPLDASTSTLGNVTVPSSGTTVPTIPPFTPPQPPTVDHSAGAVPRSAPGTWVTTDDYPPSAVRAGIEGRTSFRLDIGTDGKPANCTVLASSGSDDLDKTACRKLMSRARFKPALDMAGNPTATTYAGGVTWKLPAE